ncbi:MAG: pyridoxamine 5'-phosphate oxidase family protein [Oscillospiraceae bacterium]|nr:pyridoxamine 5'-phosphate oxidase family protein [Oscillospiraceae bacterium]
MNEFDTLWEELGSSRIMVLSTCADGRVTSRSMSVVIYDGKLWCQTNMDYMKCAQIRKNHNVSLCWSNISVEGECRILGAPYTVSGFLAAMDRAYPDAVKRWAHIPEERVLEITPSLVRSWVYEDGVPYIRTWDMRDMTYRKERQ